MACLSDSLATAHIDSLEFARRGGSYEVDVAVADLERLNGLAQDGSGRLHCRVVGERDQEGNLYLVLSVGGELLLHCQRCLGALPWPVRVNARLLLVPPGGEWPDEDLVEDGCDAIAADREMALLPLFEDELILGLPLSPRHEGCDLPAAEPDGDADRSPFAALAKFKK